MALTPLNNSKLANVNIVESEGLFYSQTMEDNQNCDTKVCIQN